MTSKAKIRFQYDEYLALVKLVFAVSKLHRQVEAESLQECGKEIKEVLACYEAFLEEAGK